jgi:hypothetical protein
MSVWKRGRMKDIKKERKKERKREKINNLRMKEE